MQYAETFGQCFAEVNLSLLMGLCMKSSEQDQLDWKNSMVSTDMQYHEIDGIPMYEERYDEVLSFHAPGLAPVRKGERWFHITPGGKKAYSSDFDRAFGYYYGLAAVTDHGKWFHINPDGNPAYRDRFKWTGNFQENLCVVMDTEGYFYHIDSFGKRIYDEKYRYAGDFHEGAAAVQGDNGLFFHITKEGLKLNSSTFLEAGAFHKGFATVRDDKGWFHCNREGGEAYSERYYSVEPFYNGLAKVTCFNGEIRRINETGRTANSISPSFADPFMRISHDLVGYWKSFLLGKAIEAGIFELLPGDLDKISKGSSMPNEVIMLIMQALQERKYVERHGDIWTLAGEFGKLSSSEKFSLRAVSDHWLNQMLPYWLSFLNKGWNNPVQSDGFTHLMPDSINSSELTSSYEDAMTAYAVHDYKGIANKVDFCVHKRIIDAGGGEGYLCKLIASECPESEIYLMEAPAVIKSNELHGPYPKNVKLIAFDLFSSWNVMADAVILAKILHDWSDENAEIILRRSRETMMAGGKMYIIEGGFVPVSGKNGLLSLHLYLVNKGKERSNEEIDNLLQATGFRILQLKKLDSGFMVYECEAV
jgi:hypothetical protein